MILMLKTKNNDKIINNNFKNKNNDKIINYNNNQNKVIK